MDTTHLCPSCGKPLAPNAPKRLCPECLLKAGFPTGSQADQAGGAQPKSAGFVPPKREELAPHFPQLEILELLGQGGMGAVYKARQKGLDRLVALKVLPPETAGSSAFAERFTREARAMARLNHPNIVAVYDFGQVSGTGVPPADVGQASSLFDQSSQRTGETPVPLYYFLMEYVDGVNLRQMLQAHRLSPREALAIVPQICDALQYAHDQGIVHRDIKPENALVDKHGRVKIADFGLAKLLGKDPQGERLTRSAEVMGTPQYMAPEQLEKPLEVDHRADIYSLGVVFYEMLTGELPLGRFGAPSSRMHGVQIDVRLDEVVLRALEKEPERRYQQASVLKTEVETIAGTAPRKQGDDREETSRTVKWPAIGLIVSALLNPVIPVLLIVMREVKWANWMVWPLAVMLVLMVLAVQGGFNMLRLGSYRAAVTGGLAAMVLAICNINPLGPPFAFWALFVLSRREVREAFTSTHRAEQPAAAAWLKAAGVARWTARIVGTLWGLMFLTFVVGEGSPAIPQQPAAVQVEFIAMGLMLVGFIMGWRWDSIAMLLTLGGWMLFHLAERHVDGFSLFHVSAVVGVLFAVSWAARRPITTRAKLAWIALACAVPLLAGMLINLLGRK